MDGYGYTALHPTTTELPMTIWFGTPMGFEGGEPRILAASVLGTSRQLDRYFSVHLDRTQNVEGDTGLITPSDVSKVEDFVQLNQFAFVAHWQGKIDTAETLALLALPDKLNDSR